MKLRKNDLVQVVAGKDKGKTAKIEKVFPVLQKVLLPSINQYKRHVKARFGGQTSEIKTINKPLPVANVMLICPKCHKPTRVGYLIEKGKKERVCRKCKKTI